jgi:uncharacterized membrane protein
METFTQALGLYGMIYLWLIAGIFFAFSDFVMKSLNRMEEASAIEAMQSINLWVYRSFFMIGLYTMVPVSLLGIGFWAVADGSALFAIGGAFYLVGVILVSGLGNIPLNHKLAVMNADAHESKLFWIDYVQKWSAFNHLRVLGSAVAALCFTFGAVSL